MRKQKLYIGRRRKQHHRGIPWFMKRIRMTFTETTDSPVRDFLDRWSSLAIKEHPDAECQHLDRDYFNEWTTGDNGDPVPPFHDKVFHIDLS